MGTDGMSVFVESPHSFTQKNHTYSEGQTVLVMMITDALQALTEIGQWHW